MLSLIIILIVYIIYIRVKLYKTNKALSIRNKELLRVYDKDIIDKDNNTHNKQCIMIGFDDEQEIDQIESYYKDK